MGLRRPSVITVANEQVRIEQVLRWVGVQTFDDMGHRRKLRCPFGELNHSDGGVELALRVYEGNYAWCFSCQVRYTPVELAQRLWDVDRKTAATMLLDKAGYKPVNLAQAWADVSTDVPVPPNRAPLAEALKIYCRRTCPDWMSAQFESPVAQQLSRCLTLLDLVRTDDDAHLWLQQCKRAMDHSFGLYYLSE